MDAVISVRVCVCVCVGVCVFFSFLCIMVAHIDYLVGGGWGSYTVIVSVALAYLCMVSAFIPMVART